MGENRFAHGQTVSTVSSGVSDPVYPGSATKGKASFAATKGKASSAATRWQMPRGIRRRRSGKAAIPQGGYSGYWFFQRDKTCAEREDRGERIDEKLSFEKWKKDNSQNADNGSELPHPEDEHPFDDFGFCFPHFNAKITCFSLQICFCRDFVKKSGVVCFQILPRIYLRG